MQKNESRISQCCKAKVDEQQIRELAYDLWERAGKPESDGKDFWYEAELCLKNCDSVFFVPPVPCENDVDISFSFPSEDDVLTMQKLGIHQTEEQEELDI